MGTTINIPKTLQDAILLFSDEQVCIDAVAAMRWFEGAECPHCAATEPYYLKTQKRWKCRTCRRQFSVKVGTIFEDSAIPLQKWLPALWMLVNDKNGISSYELHRALGVSQKSAWFMLHRLRLVMQSKGGKIGGHGSEIEVDETFIGGKARNMHKSRRIRTNVREGNWAKTIVVGMLQRDGQIKEQVIPDREKPALHAAIAESIGGSQLYTDKHVCYMGISADYAHQIVNHLQNYVDGRVHTNGLENFWSLLKRGLAGTYVSVEPFHLFRYVDEQVFRFNNRATKENPLNDSDRFVAALANVAGKRLTFKEVTGKTGSEAIN